MLNPRFLRFTMLALAMGLALVAFGCSNAANKTTTMTAANVQFKIGDAPADSVLSLVLTITHVDLMQQGGGTITVLDSPTKIELTHLAGTVESFVAANVPPGTYQSAAVSISTVDVTYIPASSTTPVEKTFTLNTTINVMFNPAVTISKAPSVLSFDFNAAQSLTFDSAGNVTGINPVITVSVQVISSGEQENDEEHGEIEDMVGTISGAMAASFALTPEPGSSAQTFTVDANTKFEDGIPQFADLNPGMLVEVDAVTQSDGSLLATKVELMEASEGMEADGIVTATSGTSVTLLVLHEGGNMSTDMVGTPLTVDVSNAVFKSPLGNSDFSMLLRGLPFTPKFDKVTVAVGQRVQVNAPVTSQMKNSFSATQVRLQRQALSGTVGAAPMGSNASFLLLLDADSAFVKLTGVSSVNVYQGPGTQEMTPVAPSTKIRVRGLLFFDGTNYQFVAARVAKPD
ncbi:MAG: hypothetical protein DMG69_25860 [Acidobacteria bacterium]|nr:MAG: hypothetical protein DMG69_25860 [Acidobacteriota bacterium]